MLQGPQGPEGPQGPPGTPGTTDHTALLNLDTADQHPSATITGLQTALDGKEPAIGAKGTGFNKNFGTIADTVAEGNHNHGGAAGPYEPAFTKNTGFNKNFGSLAGTVSEGNHGHVWADISDPPATFPPAAHEHDWSDITTGVPATFPPSTHTHLWADITDKPSTFAPSAHTHLWADITDKPLSFPPDNHSHPASAITVTPTGGITETDVQAALVGLDGRIGGDAYLPLAGGTMTGDLVIEEPASYGTPPQITFKISANEDGSNDTPAVLRAYTESAGVRGVELGQYVNAGSEWNGFTAAPGIATMYATNTGVKMDAGAPLRPTFRPYGDAVMDLGTTDFVWYEAWFDNISLPNINGNGSYGWLGQQSTGNYGQFYFEDFNANSININLYPSNAPAVAHAAVQIGGPLIPSTEKTVDLGDGGRSWRYFYCEEIIGENEADSGYWWIGTDATDDIWWFWFQTGGLLCEVKYEPEAGRELHYQDITPSANNTRDLGESTMRWRIIYSNNNLNVSDPSLKQDIAELPSLASRASQLRPIQYNWLEEYDNTRRDPGRYNAGFDAVQIRSLFPEYYAQVGDSDGERLVDPLQLLALLWAYVNELHDEIETLKQ